MANTTTSASEPVAERSSSPKATVVVSAAWMAAITPNASP